MSPTATRPWYTPKESWTDWMVMFWTEKPCHWSPNAGTSSRKEWLAHESSPQRGSEMLPSPRAKCPQKWRSLSLFEMLEPPNMNSEDGDSPQAVTSRFSEQDHIRVEPPQCDLWDLLHLLGSKLHWLFLQKNCMERSHHWLMTLPVPGQIARCTSTGNLHQILQARHRHHKLWKVL